MERPPNQFEKVTKAVLRPEYGRGRTKQLIQRTDTNIRKLIRQSDQLLNEIEELNFNDVLEMPTGLRVRLFHFLLLCDLEPASIPLRVSSGQGWVFKAQEYLFGITTGEDYDLAE